MTKVAIDSFSLFHVDMRTPICTEKVTRICCVINWCHFNTIELYENISKIVENQFRFNIAFCGCDWWTSGRYHALVGMFITYGREEQSGLVKWVSSSMSIELLWETFTTAGICSLVLYRFKFWDLSQTSPEDIYSRLNHTKSWYETI
jgi:hypothetical protein